MTRKAQNINDESSADEHSQQDVQETQSQTSAVAEPELRRRSSEEAVDTSQVEVSAEEENCCKDDESCCEDDENCQDGTVCEREDEDCCKNVANCAERENVDPETPEEDKTSKSSKKKWTKNKKKMMLLGSGLVALSTALIINLCLAFGGEPPEPITAQITTDTTLQVTTTVPVTTAAITTDSIGGQTTASPTTASPTTAAPTTAAPTWFALAQNNEKRHHAVFDPTWTVSFSLYPTGVSSSLTNIVHLSTGYNDVNYGDKVLAVYFLPNTQHLRFDSDINANYGYSYSYNSSDIPLNQWTNVTVSQTYANSTSKYTFAIEIDGTEVHSLENTRAQQFFGVKEYWSNPWADAALANVDNVTVLTSRDIGSWSDDEIWFNTSDREVWWPNVPKLYKRYELTIDAIYVGKVSSQSYMMYVHTVPIDNCNGWVTEPIQHIKFFGSSHRNVDFFFDGDSVVNGMNAVGVQQLKIAQEYHNNTYDRVLYRDGVEVYKMENYLGSAVHDNVFGYACPPGCHTSGSSPICADFLIRNFRIRSFPDFDGATRSFHVFHNMHEPNPRATAGATPLLQNYILLIFTIVYSLLFV